MPFEITKKDNPWGVGSRVTLTTEDGNTEIVIGESGMPADHTYIWFGHRGDNGSDSWGETFTADEIDDLVDELIAAFHGERWKRLPKPKQSEEEIAMVGAPVGTVGELLAWLQTQDAERPISFTSQIKLGATV